MNDLEAHRLTELANQALGSEENATNWLLSPKRAFDGVAPVAVAAQDQEGYERVRQKLLQIKFTLSPLTR